MPGKMFIPPKNVIIHAGEDACPVGGERVKCVRKISRRMTEVSRAIADAAIGDEWFLSATINDRYRRRHTPPR